jgi:hypothetical protein
MERLNLNVPAETRAALKRLAARSRRKEAELARDLLYRAIDEAEREEFFSAMSEMSPAARSRLRAIATAVEKVRAGAR